MNPSIYTCDSCGWTGSEYQMAPFDDGNSTSYACPMCGSVEIYETPEEEDEYYGM